MPKQLANSISTFSSQVLKALSFPCHCLLMALRSYFDGKRYREPELIPQCSLEKVFLPGSTWAILNSINKNTNFCFILKRRRSSNLEYIYIYVHLLWQNKCYSWNHLSDLGHLLDLHIRIWVSHSVLVRWTCPCLKETLEHSFIHLPINTHWAWWVNAKHCGSFFLQTEKQTLPVSIPFTVSGESLRYYCAVSLKDILLNEYRMGGGS